MSDELYCSDAWLKQLGSKPVRVIASEDNEPSDWGIDRALLWELENGKYAVIWENGCSCYDSDEDAAITIWDTYEEAKKEFEPLVVRGN